MPVFPPLFSGLATVGADPLAVACELAREGCDAGLVTHDVATDRLRGAIVFAPEVTLERGAAMLPVCGLGFQNALGALAPPEVPVHLGWDGTIWLNSGRCGALTLTVSDPDPGAVPDWLVVGLSVDLWSSETETGRRPDDTTLFAEGCAEVAPDTLLEAWVRHSLVWLNTWDDGGTAPLLREWTGIAHGVGTDILVAGQAGRFLGVDEEFALLLKQDDSTRRLPLTALLKEIP